MIGIFVHLDNVVKYLKDGKTIDDLKKIRSFDKAMEIRLIKALKDP